MTPSLDELHTRFHSDHRLRARLALHFAEVMLLWGAMTIVYSELYVEDLHFWGYSFAGFGLLALAVYAVPALKAIEREGESAEGEL
jgi:hypothetical protein